MRAGGGIAEQRFCTGPDGDVDPLMARIGAVIFMISDSLIALGLYKQTPAPEGSVWITYAIAQILLARGFSEATRAKMLLAESRL